MTHAGTRGAVGGTRKRGVLSIVLALIALPSLVAMVEATSFYSHHASNGSLVSDGVEREYLLYVPPGHDASKPTPLVISLHGATLWPGAHRDITRWNDVADEFGFLVVYPSGRKRGPRVWQAGQGDSTGRDVRFIANLIDTLMTRHNIDARRVYADGLSNGGGMAYLLSCTLPDRIAAVGLVGAALFLPWPHCMELQPGPVPMIMFHGTAEQEVPYEGGRTWVAEHTFPNVPRWVARWAQRNGCAPVPRDSAVTSDVTQRSFRNCAAGADVVLYTIHGGGHTWPGGGPAPEWFVGRTTHSVSASRLMWTFFSEHPLQAR